MKWKIMEWSLAPEQQQMPINAKKNIPLSPHEAEEAAKIHDRVNQLRHQRAIDQAIFVWRDRVKKAQCDRLNSIEITLNTVDVEADIMGLNTVKADLIDKGWYAHAKVKSQTINDSLVAVLHWSTKPITWWTKLWL